MAQGEMEIERNCAASNPFFYPLGAKKTKQKNSSNNYHIVLVNHDFVGNMDVHATPYVYCERNR